LDINGRKKEKGFRGKITFKSSFFTLKKLVPNMVSFPFYGKK